MSTDNSPSTILSEQTFELRMVLHKQISSLLRFTTVVLVCLFKDIDISYLFKAESTKVKVKLPSQTNLRNYQSKPEKLHSTECSVLE